MRTSLQILLRAALLAGIPAARSLPVPEIAFDSAADPLKFPDNIHLGEAAGVATNSKGDSFCLYADRPSDDLARHRAAVRARRLAAVPVR